MPAIQIRKAEVRDAPRMADIAYRAWVSGILPVLDEGPGLRESERKRLAQAVGHGWQTAIVAVLDDVVLGWCSRQTKRAYIPYLFVMPEVQGHGIGAMLLDRMETMLELEGASHVRLETPADHVRAVRFYERQGYQILALKQIGGRENPFSSVHLEKRLHPFNGTFDDE